MSKVSRVCGLGEQKEHGSLQDTRDPGVGVAKAVRWLFACCALLSPDDQRRFQGAKKLSSEK